MAAADLDLLRNSMGNQAEYLQRRALGKDSRSVRTERGRAKSISQERTFSEDISDPQELVNQILTMSASLCRTLQKRNLLAHTVNPANPLDQFGIFTFDLSLRFFTFA